LTARQVDKPKASTTTTASLSVASRVITASWWGPLSEEEGGLTPRARDTVGATHLISSMVEEWSAAF
jgi:hypothetical protein